MNPWINIALALVPEVRALIASLIALRKKYPTLTPAEISDIIQNVTSQADNAFDDVLARIAADQPK